MEILKPPISKSMPTSRPYHVKSSAPKFAGVATGLSSLVGFIDSNRLIELMASDGIGMILPRTGMAYYNRGPDDGRETFLRESFGLVGNVLLAGIFGYGVMQALGNSVNWLNPLGLPGKAWINADNLEAFGKLYTQALQTSKSTSEAKNKFLDSIFKGLESDNHQFLLPSQLESVAALPKEQQPALLEALLEKALGSQKLQSHLEGKSWKSNEEKVQFLKEELKGISELPSKNNPLEPRNGKLNPENREQMIRAFWPESQQKDAQALTGTLELDKQTEEILKAWEKIPQSSYGHRLKTDANFRQKEFLKQRLKLFKASQAKTESFVEFVDQQALGMGLSSKINLRDAEGELLVKEKSRRLFLQELKFFLENFVSRAEHEASGDLAQMQVKLLGNAPKGFLKAILPKTEDGLINAAMKSKYWLSGLPVLLSVLAAGGFTFYNQHLTTKKYGGKVFFPGEGLPKDVPSNKSMLPNHLFPKNQYFKPLNTPPSAAINNGGVVA